MASSGEYITFQPFFLFFFLVGYYSGDTSQAVKAQQSQQEIGHSQKN